MKQSIQVLMIDDSPIIDRRVLVEAQSLQANGFQVALICPAKNSSESGESIVQGISCFRVKVSDEASMIHQAAVEPNLASQSRFRRWLRERPRLFHIAREIYRTRSNFVGKLRELPRLARACLAAARGQGESFFLEMDEQQRTLFNFARDSFSSVAIVHAHDLSILNVGIALKNHFGSRLVFDAHEVYGLQYRRADPVRYYYNLKERYLAGLSDAVITVNKDCVDLIRQNVGDLNLRYFEVSNAVDLPKDFAQKRIAKRGILRRYAGLSESDQVLIFTGGINKLRKVHLLIEAMKQVDSRIHLFLMPLPFQVKEFRELAKLHGVDSRVHFGPFVDSEEVLYWIADADVGIMPYQPVAESIAFSSPNKMFEFIACGLPMIGSRGLKNVRYAIETHRAGVCLNLVHVDDYARAIDEMFDPKLGGFKRFVPAIESMQAEYSWATQVPSLLACYRMILEIRR
jgi:glycosyltransferase involved in cell wall biosynthesis